MSGAPGRGSTSSTPRATPGLRRLDDQAFVAAFQALDRAIVNPWFMALGFLGAPVLTAVALARTREEPAAAWVGTALVLIVVAMAVTARVHLPRNDALKAAGEPRALPVADLAAARTAFDEGRWVRWNLVRVGTSVAATRCLAWALVLTGRVTG